MFDTAELDPPSLRPRERHLRSEDEAEVTNQTPDIEGQFRSDYRDNIGIRLDPGGPIPPADIRPPPDRRPEREPRIVAAIVLLGVGIAAVFTALSELTKG